MAGDSHARIGAIALVCASFFALFLAGALWGWVGLFSAGLGVSLAWFSLCVWVNR
jgi:hypothetical protein